MTSTSANLSLDVTLDQVIRYLVSPLRIRMAHAPVTINLLELCLRANLHAYYGPTWDVKDPLRNAGRRCLTLSPFHLPPGPIRKASDSAGVQWSDWIAALGNQEFDLLADPGVVSIHRGPKNMRHAQPITIWRNGVFQCEQPLVKAQSKTLAQQLLEEDQGEYDQLFSLISDQINAPAWTPLHDTFPIPVRSYSPLPALYEHSRSSSRSSNSSSTFSSCAPSSRTSSTTSSAPASDKPKQSRRERARQANIFVDKSKREVTPYDGGKTTVLTGGVMLGGARLPARKPAKATRPTSAAAASWRSTSA